MDHSTVAMPHEQHEAGGGTKEILKVTLILTVLTLLELALGFSMMGMPDGGTKHFIKGAIIILMLAKAFYIVGYFMHLKHEVRNLIMTIVVPLILFVWFIIAFLSDGDSYNKLRNRYNPEYKARTHEQAPPREEPKKLTPEQR